MINPVLFPFDWDGPAAAILAERSEADLEICVPLPTVPAQGSARLSVESRASRTPFSGNILQWRTGAAA